MIADGDRIEQHVNDVGVVPNAGRRNDAATDIHAVQLPQRRGIARSAHGGVATNERTLVVVQVADARQIARLTPQVDDVISAKRVAVDVDDRSTVLDELITDKHGLRESRENRRRRIAKPAVTTNRSRAALPVGVVFESRIDHARRCLMQFQGRERFALSAFQQTDTTTVSDNRVAEADVGRRAGIDACPVSSRRQQPAARRPRIVVRVERPASTEAVIRHAREYDGQAGQAFGQ